VPAVLVRFYDRKLYKRLSEMARQERRSRSAQVELLLERVLPPEEVAS
jgi:hypothetical protein